MKFYMNAGSDGNITGFYLDTINKVIPESAIPITQEQYEQIYKEPYKFVVDNGSIRAKTQEEIDAENANLPTAPKSPDQLRIEQLETQLAQQNSDNITFTEFILQTLGVE